MAAHDHGMALAQALHQIADLDDLDGVEAHGGLVEDDDVGVADERLRDAHALLVALREVLDGTADHLFQPAGEPRALHLFRHLQARQALRAGDEVEVLPHGHVAVEGRLLGQVPDPALHLVFIGVYLQAVVAYLAVGGGQATGHDVHRRGFPRTVGTQQPADRATLHGKGDVVDGEGASVSSRQMLDLNHVRAPIDSRSFPEGTAPATRRNRCASEPTRAPINVRNQPQPNLTPPRASMRRPTFFHSSFTAGRRDSDMLEEARTRERASR